MALSRIESPKTSAEPAKPVVHAPSVLNKITDAHEDNGQVVLSSEELSVPGGGLLGVMIREVQMLPVLDMNVKPFTLLLNDWSADMRLNTELDLSFNNFNFATSNWEPLIEPWTVSLRYERNLSPESSTFTISSGKRLEINAAAQFVDTTTNLFTYLDKDNRVKEEARHLAPFRIRNHTGYRISVYSESPLGSSNTRNHVHHLDNGYDMPWSFGDWHAIREHATEMTYNRLAVQIEDMPWERVRHIAVDHEGEYVMTLRPKLENISHRLLCEVMLDNNI